MNDSSSVRGNSANGSGGGFFFNEAIVTLNDSSTVTRNHANDGGGGIWTSFGTITMNDSSSVTENHGAGGGGGIWRDHPGTLESNDSSSVRGNTADHGEDNIGGINQVDSGTHISVAVFVVMAILILALIAAGVLLARPLLRAAALTTITGMVGMHVISTGFVATLFGEAPDGPEEWLISIAYGWFLGVTVGALLGVVVFRLRADGWPSEGDVWPIASSAFVVSIVMAVPALFLYSNLMDVLTRRM